jgi:transcriptional regulator with XRE-family HTH domain
MLKYADVPTTSLAERIRRARGELSQVKFAEDLGVDPITVSRWERGEVTPGMKAVRILCRDYGFTLDDFEDVA